MLVCFGISFIFVMLVRSGGLKEHFSINEYVKSFFLLKLPGTSSWYFKIQLLFYIMLALSNSIKKNQCFIVSALVFTYAMIASTCGLADYWWKTSMCFAVGCIIAKYREVIAQYVYKIWILVFVVAAGLVCFIYTRIDFHYILIPQLISYVVIAVCITMVWNYIGGKSLIWDKIGKTSLVMYLVHIGIVDTVYALPGNTNAKTLIFIGLIVFGTLICYVLSERVNKLLL